MGKSDNRGNSTGDSPQANKGINSMFTVSILKRIQKNVNIILLLEFSTLKLKIVNEYNVKATSIWLPLQVNTLYVPPICGGMEFFMKFCSQPFTQIYIGSDNGNVTPCPWMYPDKCQVGYLWNSNEDERDLLDELISSPRMKELKDSILDGSFRYCRFEACPIMQRDEYEDLPEDKIELLCEKEPEWYNLAYDFVCNQSCPSCRSDVFKKPKHYTDMMKTIEDQLIPRLVKAKKVSTSGMGDPFASKYMMSLLERLHPERKDFELVIETNGVCFDHEHWKRIKHFMEFNVEVTVTINSFNEQIYNQISRNGNLTMLINNLQFIRSLRECGEINRLDLVMVTQDRNFRDIPYFCERCLNEFGADVVLLRPIYQWGRFSEEEYWFKDVLNPLHPYHKEYLDIIEDPRVKNNPKVYNFAGSSTHECRPYPGTGNAQRNYELEALICEKDDKINKLSKCIDGKESTIEELNNCIDTKNIELSDRDQLEKKMTIRIFDLEKHINDIFHSNSWKIGRAITYIPRKLFHHK